MKSKINKKLDEIFHKVLDSISVKSLDYGLFTGKSGLILFLYYYAALTKSDKYKLCANDCLENIFLDLNQRDSLEINICEGVVGVYSMLCHLEQFEIVSNTLVEYDSEFDDFVYDRCIQYFERRNFDYLYGASGLLFYLVQRYELSREIKYLSMINNITHLIYLNLQRNFAWFEYFHNISGNINLGIAHGLTSLFLIYTKIINWSDEMKFEYSFVLSSISSYYMRFLDQKNGNSYFPDIYNIYENSNWTYDTRLAWCYGDLGCLKAILNYSLINSDSKLFGNVIKILKEEAISRRDLNRNMIIDAGLCHGSSGIANYFQSLFYAYKCREFKEAAQYWYSITLDFSKYEHGYAGYCEAAKFNGEIYYKKTLDFIGGISGIGLSFISYISPKYSTWNDYLLFNTIV